MKGCNFDRTQPCISIVGLAEFTSFGDYILTCYFWTYYGRVSWQIVEQLRAVRHRDACPHQLWYDNMK